MDRGREDLRGHRTGGTAYGYILFAMMSRIAVYWALFAAESCVSAAGPVVKCESLAQRLSGFGSQIDSATLVVDGHRIALFSQFGFDDSR